jgi:uncharacterized damage-inducible protein DinB
VADRKPSPLVGDERSTLLAALQFQRESLVRKVAGVPDEAARRSMVPSGTSLLWLVKHMARAEVLWVLRRFAGHDTPAPDDVPGPAEALADAVARYRATWGRADQVLTTTGLDERCRGLGDGEAGNLRWVLAHLVEETARHAGHADILRELIDGETGR